MCKPTQQAASVAAMALVLMLCCCCCLHLKQSGRVTLENAIRLVEGHPEWRSRVVYGDTDSLFIALPGRSREEAHRIGWVVHACGQPALL